MNTVSNQMFLAQWWEISYPIDWVCEFCNFLLINAHLSENVILTFFTFWKLGWISIFFKLESKFFRSSRYGHTCAMEAKWEQYIESAQTFIPGIKVTFGYRECVTKMQKSIHICVGKSDEELGFL